MKILRNLLYIFAVVGGIVLASANMTEVDFVYLPGLEFLAGPSVAQVRVPLALLLLGFLLVGAFVAGTGTFVEHVRLRFLSRRNEKVARGLRAELEKARAELDQARTELAARDADLLAEQARVRRLQQAAASPPATGDEAGAPASASS